MNRRKSLLLFFVFFVLLSYFPRSLGEASVTVEGVVREHVTGKPITLAKIRVIKDYGDRWVNVYQGEADINGHFVLEFPGGPEYSIYAYYDDPLTPGFDYVPSMKRVQTTAGGKLNLTLELWDGASMFLEGEALIVETTEPPSSSSYSVVDPESGGIIQFDEHALYYERRRASQLLGLDPNHIVVPADKPFMVKVDSTIEVTKEVSYMMITRTIVEVKIYSFLIDRPSHILLGKGEVLHVDLGKFSLLSSLSRVGAEASEMGLKMEEREEEGFYLAVERLRLAKISSIILEAEDLQDLGFYEASFTRLREAHTEISNLRNWLNNMYVEALRSVFLLIPFLAFTATATSYLLFEEKIQKVSGASAFYALFLLSLYFLYPGSRVVEASLFLGASVISLIAVFGITNLLPRALKGREFKGRVSLRNIVVPIFSIAKRSLRRRRLRAALTISSVTILVSSFIALTSFTTGFGLTFGRVSSLQGPSKGILVRAPKPPVIEAVSPIVVGETVKYMQLGEGVLWFFPLENFSIRWFEEQPETRIAALKFENLPRRQFREAYNPLGYFGEVPILTPVDGDGVEKFSIGAPIFGIMGIAPSAEAEIQGLNETVIEGRYLSDEDESGILISANLKEKSNARVGESLTLKTWDKKTLELEIIGIFDDERFEGLRDLDGQSPLPMKIIAARRVSIDGGYYIIERLTPCSASETLVTTWRTVSEIAGIELSRLDIVLEAEEDLNEYAKKIALNKGFRVWASTVEGVYLAELASYFEGKGLPITIPWLIVVLNVVVTMLNSLYERRRDIYIYSSIGMSPSHISGLFLAEAAVIGAIGGGIGYLIGLGWYRVMSLLELALQVRQKVSAFWCLAAMAVSMAAVLVGGITALRGSVVITPSLRRKWSVERELPESKERLELTLPVMVTEADVEEFVAYILKQLRSYLEDLHFVTRQIKESKEETEEASIRRIEFIYRSATMKLGGVYTKNKLVLRREEDSEVYTVKHLTEGSMEGVQGAGSFIRKILMEWSVERGKLERGR